MLKILYFSGHTGHGFTYMFKQTRLVYICINLQKDNQVSSHLPWHYNYITDFLLVVKSGELVVNSYPSCGRWRKNDYRVHKMSRNCVTGLRREVVLTLRLLYKTFKMASHVGKQMHISDDDASDDRESKLWRAKGIPDLTL